VKRKCKNSPTSSKDQTWDSWALKKEKCKQKGICNIFNKIITENDPNLEKTMPIQVQEASRTPNKPDQNRTTPWHIIIKTTSTKIEKEYRSLYERKTNNIQR
jgi:hypothetical protein